MKVYIVKGPGAGAFINKYELHPLPWLNNYRSFRLSEVFYDSIIMGLSAIKAGTKVVYVSGGTGAYLYIELIRGLGGDLMLQKKIGCSVVDINSEIINWILSAKRAGVCDYLVQCDEVAAVLEEFDIAFVKSDKRFVSTDALAAYVASVLQDSKLLYFKKNIPEYYVGFDVPTIRLQFHVEELIRMASFFDERPGNNFILDKQALSIIKNNAINTVLYNSDDIRYLNEVLFGGRVFLNTVIKV
jgi:uridylate kinase